MPLEAILKRIESDARKQVEEILTTAEKEAEKIRERARQEATKKGEAHLQRAIETCQKEAEKSLAAARLQARNQLLQVRQQWIDRVFEAARTELSDLKPEAYRQWLVTHIVEVCDSQEGEIILSSKDKQRLGSQWESRVRKALKDKGIGENVRFVYQKVDFSGGFIFRTPKYEVEFTFEKQLSALREKLQGKISAILFEQDKKTEK